MKIKLTPDQKALIKAELKKLKSELKDLRRQQKDGVDIDKWEIVFTYNSISNLKAVLKSGTVTVG